ncbi:MAG: MarR family transcriptional regulator [Streptosporangiales bacterium]|nr:MarR family transcriptional regulator [Streptosporangiales bacterium]
MRSVESSGRARRRLVTLVKEALRDLNIQLSLLNRQVGARVELRDVDFDCLEVLNRHGPLSPTALARRAGLHPATMTGVLDRLQRGGWVARERSPESGDRRAVTVRVLRERNAELFRLLSGMNTAMDGICADYTDEQLAVVADFLNRTAQAGTQATTDLATGRSPGTPG